MRHSLVAHHPAARSVIAVAVCLELSLAGVLAFPAIAPAAVETATPVPPGEGAAGRDATTPAQPTTLTARAIRPLVTYPGPAVLRASLISSAGPMAESNSAVVAVAMRQLGKPYAYGAAGPNAFDCSGLTMYCYSKVGIELPHASIEQPRYGVRVSKTALAPGDLVFFYNPIHHVGMYIGGGKFIHAPRTGDVVKISDLGARTNFNCAVRITRWKLAVWRSGDGGSTWVPDGYASGIKGAYSASRRVTARTLFQIRFAGKDGYAPSASSIVTVTVRPLLGTPVVPRVMSRAATFTIGGTVKPPHSRSSQFWFWRLAAGRWTREATVAAAGHTSGGLTRLRARIRLARGLWIARARFAGDADHEPATGPLRRFKVR
jgi:cell wall-associated NlpC family hydrolase